MRNLVLGRLPRRWVLGCVVSLVAVPVMGAESLPASVRACAALTDSLQRLVCYDREVAKFPTPAAKTEKSAPGTQPAQSARAEAPAGRADAGGESQVAGAAGVSGDPAGVTSGYAITTTPGARGPTAVTSTAAGAPAGTNSPAPAPKSNSTSAATASGDEHVVAHIVSIDHQANEMILHLDNGQVWQEVQSVSGDLSLREGDAVKIDRHLGSFWLTGPHVTSMKVQRKS
jgi:hypothetical protein